MQNLCEIEENRYLIASACKSAREKANLEKAYRLIQKDCDTHSVETLKYGLVCADEAILSAKTYKLISDLIPTYCTVVDCGCGTGLQQVFFNKHKAYIGIDIHNTFIKVSKNSKFIEGNVPEVLKELETDHLYVGISVLCGSVWSYIGDSMKQKFEKVIIL